MSNAENDRLAESKIEAIVDSQSPEKHQRPGFSITGHRGFHITFGNGVTISVQFGPGNYCENYDNHDWLAPKNSDKWESATAEIAMWGPGGSWITKEYRDCGDDVIGRQTPEQVATAIAWCESHPPINH